MAESATGSIVKVSRRSIESLGKLITGDSGLSKYRSGPELISFFNDFGRNDVYDSLFGSRWKYAEYALSEIDGTPAMSQAISSALDPRDFVDPDYDLEATVEYINNFRFSEVL